MLNQQVFPISEGRIFLQTSICAHPSQDRLDIIGHLRPEEERPSVEATPMLTIHQVLLLLSGPKLLRDAEFVLNIHRQVKVFLFKDNLRNVHVQPCAL